MRISIRDNSSKVISGADDVIANISLLASTKIGDFLEEDNPNLLFFPMNSEGHRNELRGKKICDFDRDNLTLYTHNIMGFIGVNKTDLRICSRFAKNDGNDYFLHYLIMKVFSLNKSILEHGFSRDSIFDFSIQLLPHYLKKALRQGLFKEYQKCEYNDSRVKGVIDVNRHTRMNTPFMGNVAYRTRVYSYDNHITQIVRHTIEYIRWQTDAGCILDTDEEMKADVMQIMDATPSYNRRERQKVIDANVKPMVHPYFSEYTELQRICMMILRHEKLKYAEDKNKISGILFDGAWLWEEYMGIVLKRDFVHFRYNEGKRWYLFEKNTQRIIPDFLSKESENHDVRQVVGDAKYILLDKKDCYDQEGAKDIYYKTIMYMFRFQSDLGVLFYPRECAEEEKTLKVEGRKSYVVKMGFPIVEMGCFDDFSSSMAVAEKNYLKRVLEIRDTLLSL